MNQLTEQLFDYSSLSSELAITTKVTAERIKLRLNRTVEDIIEIGRDLINVKESLPHGEFDKWIKAEFEMSKPTAVNFMMAYKKFGEQKNNNYFFHPTVLYALAAPSTPDEVIEKAQEKAELGEKVKVEDIKKWKIEAQEERRKREEVEAKLKRTIDDFTHLPIPEPKEIIKEVVKEVIPDDYDELKRKENILDDAERAAAILKQSTEQEIKEKQELIDHLQDRIQGERSILKMRTEENASLQAINSSIETRLKEYTRFTNYLQMIDAWVSNDLSISDPWAGFGNVDSEMLRRMSLLTIKISNEIEKIVMENTGGFTDGTTVEGFIVPASYYVENRR